MAAITASAQRLCSRARQFLIYSTFVLVFSRRTDMSPVTPISDVTKSPLPVLIRPLMNIYEHIPPLASPSASL